MSATASEPSPGTVHRLPVSGRRRGGDAARVARGEHRRRGRRPRSGGGRRAWRSRVPHGRRRLLPLWRPSGCGPCGRRRSCRSPLRRCSRGHRSPTTTWAPSASRRRRPRARREPRVPGRLHPPHGPRRGVRHAARAGAGPRGRRSSRSGRHDPAPTAARCSRRWRGRMACDSWIPRGTTCALWDLYPWPFTPADLGEVPLEAGACARRRPPAPIRRCRRTSGRPSRGRASGRTPRTAREPAAIVLRLADGRLLDGCRARERRLQPDDRTAPGRARGARRRGCARTRPSARPGSGVTTAARVDHAGPTRDLLAAVAPAAALHVTYWS